MLACGEALRLERVGSAWPRNPAALRVRWIERASSGTSPGARRHGHIMDQTLHGTLVACEARRVWHDTRRAHMASQLDLIVLGTGSAAQSVAYPCREAGWSVAVVDCRPYSGTCPLRGFDPKKVLVGVTDAVASSRRLEGKGIVAPDLRIAWPDLQRFKRTFTDPAPAQNEAGFAAAGIQMYHGTARFSGPTSVRIGDEEERVGGHVVIATAASPAHLGIPGEELLTTSQPFLTLEARPRHIAFVGGCSISY